MENADPILKRIIEKAIPLPDCPVKKQHAIASRLWLEKKITEYLSAQLLQYEQSTQSIHPN